MPATQRNRPYLRKATGKEYRREGSAKGITLIALILTIIIMLILVAVTISVVINSNILGSAKNAAKGTSDNLERESHIEDYITIDGENLTDYIDNLTNNENAGEHNWTRTGDHISCSHCDEEYDIGDPYEYTCGGTGTSTISGETSGMKAYLTGGGTNKTGVDSTTGDQTISRDSNTTWVVLGIADSKTLLITTAKPTDAYFYLYGEYGYNAMDEDTEHNLLDRVCRELYGENARGMRMADVDSCFNYTPAGGWIYGETIPSCTGNFTTRIDSLSTWNSIKSHGTYTPDGTNTEAKLGSYEIDVYGYIVSSNGTSLSLPNGSIAASVTEEELDVIFGEESNYGYWLASRGVGSDVYYAEFGPGYVYANNVSCIGLFQSNGSKTPQSLPVRPVVSII